MRDTLFHFSLDHFVTHVIMLDARVLYVLSVLKDLYPGDWRYEYNYNQNAPRHHCNVVNFYEKGQPWLRIDLKDNGVRGKACDRCRDTGWGWWTFIDFCNDNEVRSVINNIVGIDCPCDE
jgi:hypothetical protein